MHIPDWINIKLLVAAMAGLLFLPGMSPAKEVFFTGFEESQSLKDWTWNSRYTAAKIDTITPGQLSKACLAINKPDLCGVATLENSAIISSPGWYRLSYDICTKKMGPYASWYVMIKPQSEDSYTGPNIFLAFKDSLTMDNKFGGLRKTPQTLGEWRRSENLFELPQGLNSVKITLVVSEGWQEILVDNLRLEYVGPEQPPQGAAVVFARKIDWPYAQIDLDNLLPGATYQIKASIKRPAPHPERGSSLTPNSGPSSEIPPEGLRGMGISAAFTNHLNKISEQLELFREQESVTEAVYTLSLPPDVIETHLDFHNDDLVRFNHNQIEAQARRWDTVEITLQSIGEVVLDNAYSQFIYRGRPEKYKPRQVKDPSTFDLKVTRDILQNRKPVDARVENINGGMWITLDGNPVPPILAHGNDTLSDYGLPGDAFSQVKINTIDYPGFGTATWGGWLGPGQYDWSALDKCIMKALNAAPDAHLVLIVRDAYPPLWWIKKHKDELVRDQKGETLWCYGRGLYHRYWGAFEQLQQKRQSILETENYMRSWGAGEIGFYFPSPASEAYRECIADFLTDLRHHIESQPYGSAVIGYWPTWGYDGQWGMIEDIAPTSHANSDGFPHFTDFSQPMLRRFRRYLQEKYSSIEALRKSWNHPDVTFDSAELPGITRRNLEQPEGHDYLLDPATDQPVIDYRECENLCVGELLNVMCRALKKAGRREVITATYFPDISGLASGSAGSQRGHEVVLNQPWLDISGNPGYHARQVGLCGTTGLTQESYRLHGKIAMKEIDHRVFPVMRRLYRNNLLFETPRKSISVLEREFMSSLCHGGGAWTYDMAYGWYKDPIIAHTVDRAYNLYESTLSQAGRKNILASQARMAVFYGEQGKNVQADGRRGAIPQMLVTKLKTVLPHAGFPIDEYLLGDLPEVADRYDVLYFPFAYGLANEDREAIEACKRDNKLLVFGYGAGLAIHDKDIRNVEALTGMSMASREGLNLTVEFTEKNHPITQELQGFMGTADSDNYQQGLPGLYVDDPEADALACFPGPQLRAGLALKEMDDWQSLYIGTIGLIPPALLRGIARYSGLHIYSDSNDAMYFAKGLVGIHSHSIGKKQIDLPEKAFVTSLWDNKPAGRMKSIIRPMRVGENALYIIEPKRR
jgi:hypothetical protein